MDDYLTLGFSNDVFISEFRFKIENDNKEIFDCSAILNLSPYVINKDK